MSSALKATALLGGSSVISAGFALIAAKVMAVLVGPAGVGRLAGFQSILSISVIIAGFGVGTGIVRAGARAISAGDEQELRSNWLAGLGLTLSFGTAGALLLWLCRDQVNLQALGGSATGTDIGLVALAVLGTVTLNFFIGYLNAHHRVLNLAGMTVGAAIINMASLTASVYFLGVSGVAVGMALSAVTAAFLGLGILTYVGLIPSGGASATGSASAAAKGLIRFGGPYTLSMILGTGLQVSVPLLILHELGTESAGYYRAAFGISSISVSLILNAFGQDYYPRLSAAADDRDAVHRLINQQQRLAVALLGPLFLALSGLAAIAIPILYSSAFLPAVPVLRWVILGDLLKSISWVFSFVLLARSRTSGYLLAEMSGGLAALGFVLVGLRAWGIEGAGMGYAASYLIYLTVVAIIVRKEVGRLLDRENLLLVVFIVLGIGGLSVAGHFHADYLFYSILAVASSVALWFLCKFLISDPGFRSRLISLKAWRN